MIDTFIFPRGHEVKILRKQDVLDCIDENIIDKEVALAIVTKCELDCANYLIEGKAASIPFMGNFKIPKAKQMLASKEQQELIKDAYDNLESSKYVMFRKELNRYNESKIRFEKSYKYFVSMMVNRYNKLYKYLLKTKGEYFSRITMYSMLHFEVITDEYKELYYD